MNFENRKLIPIAIFGGLLLIAVIIRMNPPEAPQRPVFSGPVMTVETQVVAETNYPIVLESYGTVQPRTRSILVAQVGGQIVSVNPNVRDGGFFEEGDVLANIDARDYEADVRIAGALLMDARQTLAEAEARTNQAQEDWARLGNTGEAPDLVLRIPQLKAAQAKIISAESTLQKAELNLERTNIVAPFAGRVLRKLVDLGQVVSPNTQLAEIYATDVVEIRLPLRNRDLPFIDLPESYRYTGVTRKSGGRVEIRSQLGGDESWEAMLVRTEGAIDEIARQLHVIAQIDDPFGRDHEYHAPLKIGQYVTARLEGKTLPHALVIPNNTIYQGAYVYIVENEILRRREIEIAWQNNDEAVIGAGLEPGDILVTTPLGQVTSGIRVTVVGEQGERRMGRNQQEIRK
ncbi:MAG: efflux RND transporter periplasmic adaptor subunit [Proteobacteria bacterium]|nr:efflux RND transporter periplasmic adaptor subunit [Pseudomonadota bacterium]